MPAAGHVKVHGLRELNRAFAKMGSELKGDLRNELKAVGEPVRAAAQGKAISSIRNLGDVWGQMRLGVTTKVVYVAPKARPGKMAGSRRRGTPRPNLAELYLTKAMLPALAEGEPEVVRGLDRMLDRLADKGGF